MTFKQLNIVLWLAICVLAHGVCVAADSPPPPGPKDRCAICGMFVAKYPAWVATIVTADGARHYFDGPKDLFRYLVREKGAEASQAEIWVTDYYTTEPVRARDVVYVRGSDVMGPMGAELVPLTSPDHAESFRADHGGEAPLAFDDVDETVLGLLE